MKIDYSIITELPNTKIPLEQLERFYQRYKFAQKFSKNKRVLEIACGGGQGLNLLAIDAVYVKGIDIDQNNLNIARETYKNHEKISVEYYDANNLQFPQKSFDLILLFEAIYYLNDAQKVIRRCHDLLSDKGTIIIESANNEWKDFNPCRFAAVYFSARELEMMLKNEGFQVDLFCSYKTGGQTGVTSMVISNLKRTAVRLHLIPRSMKYKKYLKRIFLGKLVTMPSKLSENICSYTEPERIDPENYDTQFKVIYVIGYKP